MTVNYRPSIALPKLSFNLAETGRMSNVIEIDKIDKIEDSFLFIFQWTLATIGSAAGSFTMRVIIYTWRKANGNGSQQPQPLQLSFDLNQTLEQGSKGSRGEVARGVVVGGRKIFVAVAVGWLICGIRIPTVLPGRYIVARYIFYSKSQLLDLKIVNWQSGKGQAVKGQRATIGDWISPSDWCFQLNYWP